MHVDQILNHFNLDQLPFIRAVSEAGLARAKRIARCCTPRPQPKKQRAHLLSIEQRSITGAQSI